ncbi:hypothetical protein GAY31_20035 [Azospirillum brasilense]|nr:hypothetical protein [Azospirillum brasilense]
MADKVERVETQEERMERIVAIQTGRAKPGKKGSTSMSEENDEVSADLQTASAETAPPPSTPFNEAQVVSLIKAAQSKAAAVLDAEQRSDEALAEALAVAYEAYVLVNSENDDRTLLNAVLTAQGIKPETVKQVANGVIRLIFGDLPHEDDAKYELRKSQYSKYATALRWFSSKNLVTAMACEAAYKAQGGLESVCKAFRDSKEGRAAKAASNDPSSYFTAQQTRAVVIEEEQPLFTGLDDNELFVVLAQKVGGKTVLHRVLGKDVGFTTERVKKIAQRFVPKKSNKATQLFFEAAKFMSTMEGEIVYLYGDSKQTIFYCPAVNFGIEKYGTCGKILTAICPPVDFLPNGKWIKMAAKKTKKTKSGPNLTSLTDLIKKAVESGSAPAWRQVSSGRNNKPFRQEVSLAVADTVMMQSYDECILGSVIPHASGEQQEPQYEDVLASTNNRRSNYPVEVQMDRSQHTLLRDMHTAAAKDVAARAASAGRELGTVGTSSGKKVKVKTRYGRIDYIPETTWKAWQKELRAANEVVVSTVKDGKLYFGFGLATLTDEKILSMVARLDLLPKGPIPTDITHKMRFATPDFADAISAFVAAKASGSLVMKAGLSMLRLESTVEVTNGKKPDDTLKAQYIVDLYDLNNTDDMKRVKLNELAEAL